MIFYASTVKYNDPALQTECDKIVCVHTNGEMLHATYDRYYTDKVRLNPDASERVWSYTKRMQTTT